jgi:hypothetical protein
MKNEVLHRVKDERNILRMIKRRKTIWIGHILRMRCILKPVTERKIEGTERRGRRLKQPLDDLTETRGYCKIERRRNIWRTRFGRSYGPVVRPTTE